MLDDGKRMPQVRAGRFVADEKYLYWNAGYNILRIAKEGGTAEAVVTENVGIGIDMAIDNERIYWTNHGLLFERYAFKAETGPLGTEGRRKV